MYGIQHLYTSLLSVCAIVDEYVCTTDICVLSVCVLGVPVAYKRVLTLCVSCDSYTRSTYTASVCACY